MDAECVYKLIFNALAYFYLNETELVILNV